MLLMEPERIQDRQQREAYACDDSAQRCDEGERLLPLYVQDEIVHARVVSGRVHRVDGHDIAHGRGRAADEKDGL